MKQEIKYGYYADPTMETEVYRCKNCDEILFTSFDENYLDQLEEWKYCPYCGHQLTKET